MSPERFDHLLRLVGPLITKKNTRFRDAIPAGERLTITLRFLASGDSQISLSFMFRVGRKSVSRIVSETYKAIADVLTPKYVNAPKTPSEWKRIAVDFEDLWQMPHVVGAIDGKHIAIEAPASTGTLYHNYKGFFSQVLLAVCDARYNFILVDVGQFGSNNDSGVLANSSMGRRFENGTIGLPDPEYKRGYTNGLLPYYLVGDEIFALKPWMMRPYPGKLAEEERVFNYRLSRSRRVIENVFGILRARWRIFSRPIKASIENTERYIMAAVCLHNYLRQTENALYCPLGFVDSENSSGEIKRGEWRSIVGKADCFNPIARCKGGKRKEDANNMREALKAYVNSEEGSVSWQLPYVRSVGK